MPIEAEIRTQIKTLTSLSNVNLVIAPQSATGTYAVVTRISGSQATTHDGRDNTRICRIQVDIWADTYANAKDTAILAYGLCDYSSDTVALVMLDNEIDRHDADSNKYGVTLDFIILYYGE